MNGLCSSWCSWPLEQRRRALRLDDAATLRCLDAQLRTLWSCELRMRQTVPTGRSLLDNIAEHTLLSQMRLDGNNVMVAASLSAALGGKQHRLVEWHLYEDPGALQEAFLRILTKYHHSSKVINKSMWPKIFQPSAASWADFEVQLAKVLVQLLLCAESEAELQARVGTSTTSPLVKLDPLMHVAEAPDGSNIKTKQAKRQEKRSLQRLRRTHYRDAKRASQGAETVVRITNGADDEVAADASGQPQQVLSKDAPWIDGGCCVEINSAQQRGIKDDAAQDFDDLDMVADMEQPTSVQLHAAEHGHASKSCVLPIEQDKRAEERLRAQVCQTGNPMTLELNDISVRGHRQDINGDDLFGAAADTIGLQQQAQRLAGELQSRERMNHRSTAAAALASVGASAFPTVLSLALGTMGHEACIFDDEGATNPGMGLTMGQGKPISHETTGSLSMPAPGGGFGRGRFLIPPPGLSRRSPPHIPQPDGLSRLFADTALLNDYSIIPEETDGDMDDIHETCSNLTTTLVQRREATMAELAGAAPVNFSTRPELLRDSSLSTQAEVCMLPPSVSSETIAPCCSESEGSAPPSPGLYFSRVTTPQLAWPTTPSTPGVQERDFALDQIAQRTQIPTYITVPVEMAHRCPNCGVSYGMAPSSTDESLRGNDDTTFTDLHEQMHEELKTRVEQTSSTLDRLQRDVQALGPEIKNSILQSINSLAASIDERFKRIEERKLLGISRNTPLQFQ